MNRFDILFFFNNPKKSLLEVKRNSPANNADLSNTFYWLLVDKQDHSIERLDFISMCKFPDFEKRDFIQGNLTFDQKKGQYIHNDTLVRLELETFQPNEVPVSVLKAIDTYFKEMDLANI